jgi:DNA-binding protein H-NS
MATLKTMSVPQLQDLKSKVEAAISEKVKTRREELETELPKLDGGPRSRRGRPAGRGGPRGSVAPKYRNSENPSETWAGRGLKPRWLAAAIKGGKKIEDFAIAGAEKASGVKATKRARQNSGRDATDARGRVDGRRQPFFRFFADASSTLRILSPFGKMVTWAMTNVPTIVRPCSPLSPVNQRVSPGAIVTRNP